MDVVEPPVIKFEELPLITRKYYELCLALAIKEMKTHEFAGEDIEDWFRANIKAYNLGMLKINLIITMQTVEIIMFNPIENKFYLAAVLKMAEVMRSELYEESAEAKSRH